MPRLPGLSFGIDRFTVSNSSLTVLPFHAVMNESSDSDGISIDRIAGQVRRRGTARRTVRTAARRGPPARPCRRRPRRTASPADSARRRRRRRATRARDDRARQQQRSPRRGPRLLLLRGTRQPVRPPSASGEGSPSSRAGAPPRPRPPPPPAPGAAADAQGDVERRAALLVLHVELGAVLGQIAHDLLARRAARPSGRAVVPFVLNALMSTPRSRHSLIASIELSSVTGIATA